eukprot:symbB.v1.2.022369.t1/scaffold1982.1/size93808/1
MRSWIQPLLLKFSRRKLKMVVLLCLFARCVEKMVASVGNEQKPGLPMDPQLIEERIHPYGNLDLGESPFGLASFAKGLGFVAGSYCHGTLEPWCLVRMAG